MITLLLTLLAIGFVMYYLVRHPLRSLKYMIIIPGSPVTRGTRCFWLLLPANRINNSMGLYDVKKTIEAAYYKYCIKEGRLPLPDTVYYLWDKKKIERSLMQDKERSPRKEKKKKEESLSRLDI